MRKYIMCEDCEQFAILFIFVFLEIFLVFRNDSDTYCIRSGVAGSYTAYSYIKIFIGFNAFYVESIFKIFSENTTNSCCAGSYCAERGIEGKQPHLLSRRKEVNQHEVIFFPTGFKHSLTVCCDCSGYEW